MGVATEPITQPIPGRWLPGTRAWPAGQPGLQVPADEAILREYVRLMLRPDLSVQVKKALGYLMDCGGTLCEEKRGHLVDAAAEARFIHREFRPRSEVGVIVRRGIRKLVPQITEPGRGPLLPGQDE